MDQVRSCDYDKAAKSLEDAYRDTLRYVRSKDSQVAGLLDKTTLNDIAEKMLTTKLKVAAHSCKVDAS